jgi:hypothetical protein
MVDLNERDVCTKRMRDDGVARFVDRNNAVLGIGVTAYLLIAIVVGHQQRISHLRSRCSAARSFVHRQRLAVCRAVHLMSNDEAVTGYVGNDDGFAHQCPRTDGATVRARN